MNLRQYWQKGNWNWSEEAEEKSIDSFISAGKIYNYSIYENNEEEANLYGIGGALEYYSKIGDNKKAEDICLIALKMFKGLDMGEYEDLRECTFFVRGLATLNYGN